MWRYIIFLAALVLFFVNCVRIIEPGPKYPGTNGEIWPKPQHQLKGRTYYVFESHKAFSVVKPYYTCDIVDKAVQRLLFRNLINKFKFVRNKPNDDGAPKHRDKFFNGTISSNKTQFRIELTEECENYPHLEMYENYTLVVGEYVILSSASIWGILRGLESFNHLIYFSNDYTEIRINATMVIDFPEYKYRGVLIDTGRHYLSTKIISLLIDAMEMNKMNVLHWHIVDDQSFPYQSEKFPNMSKNGAFHSSMVYTKRDIQRIIERARLAGIRVIPEFDIPGHVRSWGESYPEILTKCYEAKEVVGLGPLDPTNNDTYTFLQQLYQELKELFPDKYIHLGGDEVDSRCWRSNPKIRHYMKKMNISRKMLHIEFMHKVRLLLPPQVKSMFWQEVFDDGIPLPGKTILQVWQHGWVKKVDDILNAGHQVVVSAPWYLDYLRRSWEQFFRDDPRRRLYFYRFQNETGIEGIIGGEVCMWGEKANEQNIMTRIWPRTSAVAERLWTGLDYTDENSFEPMTNYVRRRIEEHSCRMIQRGIDVEPPNGPGFCIGPVTKLGHQTIEAIDTDDEYKAISPE